MKLGVCGPGLFNQRPSLNDLLICVTTLCIFLPGPCCHTLNCGAFRKIQSAKEQRWGGEATYVVPETSRAFPGRVQEALQRWWGQVIFSVAEKLHHNTSSICFEAYSFLNLGIRNLGSGPVSRCIEMAFCFTFSAVEEGVTPEKNHETLILSLVWWFGGSRSNSHFEYLVNDRFLLKV